VDTCLTPVLAPWEAYSHPHHIAREAFLKIGGVMQPAPAPRFDRTPGEVSAPAPSPGEDTDAILQELGVHPHEISALRSRNAIA
jgi:alpha-methylacyl-CoA racemase